MQNATDHSDPLAALRTQLAGRYPAWEAWLGISGILYARRRMTSPPAVFRGATPEAVAKQITEYEEGRS